MSKTRGYIASLPNKRKDIFLECYEAGETFSEPVVDFNHSRNIPLICFVVINKKFAYIALGGRGNRSGTNLRRLNLNKIEELVMPVPAQRILELVPKKYKASIERRFKLGGLLTEKGFLAISEAIKQIIPQSSSILERYSHERTERIRKLSSIAKQNLAYQKEAVLTALSIAGINRDTVQEWSPRDDTPISFLDGLPMARLREDQMVFNDLSKIPNFDPKEIKITGSAVFESETERLTIILANRLPLEELTGTDLIYFNETFQSFVMVQYKAMEHEKDKNGIDHAVFRLPNKQLAEEITRMDALLSTMQSCEMNVSHDGFRLTENPFFLKLCPRIVFNPDDAGLVRGMYLPLNYWKLLEQHPGIQGACGGRRITYQNVGRHFDNTAFITVVSKAWVGTTPNQSVMLKDAIRQTMENGKAITIAIKPKLKA